MKNVSVSVLLIAVLFSLGCATKPEQELNSAQQALQQARTTEAESYASEEYRQAFDTLNSAMAEIAAQDEKYFFNRNYDRAKELLAQASLESEAATEAAASNKEQARMEAEAALEEAGELLAAAEAALKNAPVGKGSQIDLQTLQADLTAAMNSLEEARQALASFKYLEAKQQLNAIIAKAQSITSDIEQARSKMRVRRS